MYEQLTKPKQITMLEILISQNDGGFGLKQLDTNGYAHKREPSLPVHCYAV